MSRSIRLVRFSEKSTNGRVSSVCLLFAAVLLAAIPVTMASSDEEGDTYRYTNQAMAVPARLQALAETDLDEEGPAVRRVRNLREALLADEAGAPADGAEFAFRLAGLARSAGIVCFLVAVDTPADASVEGERLAAGVFRKNRIVIFELDGVRRLPWSRARPIGDRAATAVLLASDGQALLRAGDTRGAIERLEAAVRLDPRLAYAWHDLGTALRRDGKSERALDAYERSLQLAAVRGDGR
jgi:tetratricopeptide (TPR) repeat protein